MSSEQSIWAAAIQDAIGVVLEQQMADANRLITEEKDLPQGACSTICDGVTCHSQESHAAHNRVLARLAALKAGTA